MAPEAEILTSEEMRAAESAAMENGRVTGAELMERAGQGVVDAVLAHWPKLAAKSGRALVLCGPGNNGGDGFVVARHLAARGWRVELRLLGDAGKLPPDARLNHDRWIETGAVGALSLAAIESAGQDQGPDLVVDAVFGTGLNRPPEGELSECLGAARRLARRHVAVDVPSGYCADSGRVLSAMYSDAPHGIATDLTVTFHRAKRGHVLAALGERRGSLHIVDIGIDEALAEAGAGSRTAGTARLVEGARGAAAKRGGHKFDHGHALVLTGSFGRTGAARLSARAALRIGAGLVTLGVPGSAQMEVAAQITALMMQRVDDADDLEALVGDPRLSVLCLGPGLGVGRAETLLPAVLGAERAAVLDADALTACAQTPEIFAMLHDRCVLTPHMGEFGRLFPDLAEKLSGPARSGPAYSKIDACRAAATRAGCAVLLKGPDTVIATSHGTARVVASFGDAAVPWLATAGAGDVLAGMIAGLLARGFDPAEAASEAAWLHVRCALRFGPGLVAEDLPEMLPAVLRDLAE